MSAEQRRTDTRTRILDAAADAFMSRGFGETTVDDLAHGIGATKGLVYYHFRSKFDLFIGVYEEGMAQVRQDVMPAYSAQGTGRERLRAMAVAHLLNLMHHLGYHHVVHQGVRGQSSTALTEAQRESLTGLNVLRQEYEELYADVVEAGVADGSLRAVDVRLGTRVLLSSLNAVDDWFRRRDEDGPEDHRCLAEQIVDLLLRGIDR